MRTGHAEDGEGRGQRFELGRVPNMGGGLIGVGALRGGGLGVGGGRQGWGYGWG